MYKEACIKKFGDQDFINAFKKANKLETEVACFDALKKLGIEPHLGKIANVSQFAMALAKERGKEGNVQTIRTIEDNIKLAQSTHSDEAWKLVFKSQVTGGDAAAVLRQRGRL